MRKESTIKILKYHTAISIKFKWRKNVGQLRLGTQSWLCIRLADKVKVNGS